MRRRGRVGTAVAALVLLALVAADVAGWIRVWHDPGAIVEHRRFPWSMPDRAPLAWLLAVLTPPLWFAVSGIGLALAGPRLTPAGRRYRWPVLHALTAAASATACILCLVRGVEAWVPTLLGAVSVIAALLALMTGLSARATNADARANPGLDVDGADAWHAHRGDEAGPRPSEDGRGPGA